MTTYNVTLKSADGETTITCEDDQYILDAADEAGQNMTARQGNQNLHQKYFLYYLLKFEYYRP